MSEFPKTFTKRVKGSGVVSGICTRQEFNLEVKVLKKLQSMYECDCFPEETRVHSTTRHFPIVHDIDSKKKKIIMSYQGRPLNKLRYCRKKFSIPNWTEQLHCIVANLNRCQIKHLDIKAANMCFDSKEGVISLIDFGQSSLEGRPQKPVYNRRGKNRSSQSLQNIYTSSVTFRKMLKNVRRILKT